MSTEPHDVLYQAISSGLERTIRDAGRAYLGEWGLEPGRMDWFLEGLDLSRLEWDGNNDPIDAIGLAILDHCRQKDAHGFLEWLPRSASPEVAQALAERRARADLEWRACSGLPALFPPRGDVT
jgi:hypothetical protein